MDRWGKLPRIAIIRCKFILNFKKEYDLNACKHQLMLSLS